MKTVHAGPTRISKVSRRLCGLSSLEPLKARIAPAYTAALTGTAATFTGDSASDTLVISAVKGILQHNRFTAGDPGFASDTDFDSAMGISTSC